MRERRNNLVVAVAIGFVAGFTVLLLTLPTGGTDGDPPACYSSFGAHVACDGRLALLAAGISFLVTLLAFWLSSKGPSWIGFTLAVLGGGFVVALHLPTRGVLPDPPQCWSAFGYPVGCDTWPALVAGIFALVAGVVGAGLGRALRTPGGGQFE